MKEQIYKIKKRNSFELKDIFECGQCFRWKKQSDNSYIGIWKNNVVQVKEKGGNIIFEGICENSLQEEIENYFDLKTDYTNIKNQLAQIDENMKNSVEYGKGIRLLNQDLWETILSYIISANNNIPRIQSIIERLAQNYGKEIKWNGNCYYTFPTPEELKNVTIEEYRKMGLGFRDKRVYETVQMVLNKEVDLEKLEQNADTEEVKEELLKLSGVGTKVADCILLFSTLKRWEVFPIDVWVRRVMNELYFQQEDENIIEKKKIEKLAKEKYKDLAGIAQQYLYYWRRDA